MKFTNVAMKHLPQTFTLGVPKNRNLEFVLQLAKSYGTPLRTSTTFGLDLRPDFIGGVLRQASILFLKIYPHYYGYKC